jgi:hypothetical protein
MAGRKQSKGACSYCGRVLTRGGMARHLQTCPARQDQIQAANQIPRPSRPSGTFFHLQIQDAYSGRYWLHLEMAGSAPLGVLDQYLRAIWLECCGHLSSFSVGGAWSGREVSPTKKAGQVFRPGVELTHVYDFGTSSEATIKVVAERQGRALTKHPIALMARNEAPAFACMECEEEARWLCMECIYEEDWEGALCERHAQAHPHEDYGGPMPIVNSPRVGMCGYEGPAEPPY